jgi:hypothetical protein
MSVLLLFAATGCLRPDDGYRPGGKGGLLVNDLVVTGMILKDKDSPPDLVFVDLKQVIVDGKTSVYVIPPRKRIETKHPLLLEFESPIEPSYKTLLSPNPNGTWGVASYHRSDPVVTLTCGWVYLTGYHPAAETEWVQTGSDSSTIVLQILPATEIARFFVLQSTVPGWYKRLPDGRRVYEPSQGFYIDIPRTGNPDGPHAIVGSGDPETFITQTVQPYAEAAEIWIE